MNCSYSKNIYVMMDDKEIFSRVFGTSFNRGLICSNCILFIDNPVNNENIRGYLQFEDNKVEIKGGKRVLIFRYLNLSEHHKYLNSYLHVFMDLNLAVTDNKIIEGNLPCLIKLEDFYKNYL